MPNPTQMMGVATPLLAPARQVRVARAVARCRRPRVGLREAAWVVPEG
ncbi:MAG TPA: hypothetical protein VER33_25475 [Polyangiaceae bacterium]|nr:hypothetical protein [Polyangiaceae bacterium]